MAKKKLSWSEELVRRPVPKDSPYIDQIMAGYVRDDGTFCGRMEPSDRWLRPAFAKIKRRGWIEASFGFGKGAVIFFLSDRGKPEALAAKERVKAVREARRQWCVDWNEAWRGKQEAA
ncbi:hypothetical protein [Sinorhizobium medicae]